MPDINQIAKYPTLIRALGCLFQSSDLCHSISLDSPAFKSHLGR